MRDHFARIVEAILDRKAALAIYTEAIAAAVRSEREACARIADTDYRDDDDGFLKDCDGSRGAILRATSIAKKIRARTP